MIKPILATVAIIAISVTASIAHAGLTSTIGWGCHTCGFKNGTQMDGIALGSVSAGSVTTLKLSSGEILDLR
jgi:hypothetical protein